MHGPAIREETFSQSAAEALRGAGDKSGGHLI
jgi:hypothetical protein